MWQRAGDNYLLSSLNIARADKNNVSVRNLICHINPAPLLGLPRFFIELFVTSLTRALIKIRFRSGIIYREFPRRAFFSDCLRINCPELFAIINFEPPDIRRLDPHGTTHLHDVAEIVARRVEGELANVRHLIFLRSMQFQIVRLPHVAVVRFIASCNTDIIGLSLSLSPRAPFYVQLFYLYVYLFIFCPIY